MNPVSDESRLTAYALDELNATDRAAVERELDEHPELRAEVEQIRALAATLTRELDREDGVALDEVRREAIRKAAQTPIGWGHGDCAPWPFHTTGHAVFRIRRLNPAEVVRSTPPRAPTE